MAIETGSCERESERWAKCKQSVEEIGHAMTEVYTKQWREAKCRVCD